MFLGSACQNESNSHQLARVGLKKIFHELDVHHVLQSRNHLFLVSGGQNKSNSHQLARVGEKKIFHELDVRHVYKGGITCFSPQDDIISLTANTTVDSARKNFS